MRGGSALALAVGLSFFIGTPCFATTVEPVQGDLSLNRPGQGFKKVSEPTIVQPGDLVMVSANGTANVFFSDGCKYVLQPGSVLTINAISPCAAKSFGQAPPPPPNGQQTGPFDDPAAWGFGAAVLGLTGFAGYEISQSNKNTKPASP
jgi:hypothetical protein